MVRACVFGGRRFVSQLCSEGETILACIRSVLWSEIVSRITCDHLYDSQLDSAVIPTLLDTRIGKEVCTPFLTFPVGVIACTEARPSHSNSD
jgi:hypothetical protein